MSELTMVGLGAIGLNNNPCPLSSSLNNQFKNSKVSNIRPDPGLTGQIKHLTAFPLCGWRDILIEMKKVSRVI
jgi:hypothetical protein